MRIFLYKNIDESKAYEVFTGDTDSLIQKCLRFSDDKYLTVDDFNIVIHGVLAIGNRIDDLLKHGINYLDKHMLWRLANGDTVDDLIVDELDELYIEFKKFKDRVQRGTNLYEKLTEKYSDKELLEHIERAVVDFYATMGMSITLCLDEQWFEKEKEDFDKLNLLLKELSFGVNNESFEEHCVHAAIRKVEQGFENQEYALCINSNNPHDSINYAVCLKMDICIKYSLLRDENEEN